MPKFLRHLSLCYFLKLHFDLTALTRLVLLHKIVDSLHGVKKRADRVVMIECVDDVRHVLAHIDLAIPRSLDQTRAMIDKIGGKDLVNKAICVSLVKLIKALGKETEGSKVEDPLYALLLELASNVDERLTRGDHVIHDNRILARKVFS